MIALLNKQKERRTRKIQLEGATMEDRTQYLENEKVEVRVKKKTKGKKQGFYSHLCSACLQ